MLTGTNVLVVEPEYLIALEIQRILSDRGASVVTAQTLPAAQGEWAQLRFDLAIVSIGPEVGTLELCRSLLEAGTPVVLVSSSTEHAAGHPELPSAVAILKPFRDEDLLGAAAAALPGRCRTPVPS